MEKKKDLRIVKTEAALCDAFITLLSRKPFESITVQELCDAARIRRATFYTHFADIYDFFAFFVRRYQQEFVEQSMHIQSRNFFGQMYRQTIGFLEAQQPLLRSVAKSAAFPALLDILSDTIYRHVLSHLEETSQGSEQDIRLETVAQFYAGGLVRTLRYWVDHKMDESEKTQFLSEIDHITQDLGLK